MASKIEKLEGLLHLSLKLLDQQDENLSSQDKKNENSSDAKKEMTEL